MHTDAIVAYRRNFKSGRIDFLGKSRKQLPDLQPQRLSGSIPGDVFGGSVEKIDLAFSVSRDQASTQAVHDTVAESLQKRHLPRRFLEFRTGFTPAFRQKIRQKRDRTESENTQADDVLERRQIGPTNGGGRDIGEVAEIHVRKMDH